MLTLDKISIRKHLALLTSKQYARMLELNLVPESTELIDGIIFEKMTKSPLHSSVFSLLLRFLYANVRAPYWIRPEMPLTMENSEPEPDVSIVKGNESEYRDHHPDTAELVIEISISSLDFDRQKAAMYARANIPEYWIVMPQEGVVEVYKSPVDGMYSQKSIAEKGDTLDVPGGAILQIDSIFP